ncbi:hypothetical protein JRO89_XS14G0152300 [Xanthoceras sorbifolium]|uniref:Retrotransposon Copia-like N-terminal domain-containing protein n=1 Tax=Xanthoceras sorbifolium TaxID=99658 RepID=A0ABQ8H5F4_9ROSI|nr:hypothetical protein JRO89_XS14G0152300 [Xanthoceras sorbifolium]
MSSLLSNTSDTVGTLTIPSVSNFSAVETFSPFGGKLSHPSMINLDCNNHLLWKSIIFSVIRGYKLDGYLLGTKPCPPKFLRATTTDNYPSLNPAYEDWVIHDQLLLGWLLSSMSESILAKGLTTSHKVWTKLETVFANQSMPNALNYWKQLQSTMKGSMSIDEYLTKMKGLTDQMEVAGQPIQDSEQITIVLAGLDREYDSVVSLITHQKTVIGWSKVEAILMTQESCIEQLNAMNQITANVAINHTGTNGKPRDHGTNFNNRRRSGANPRLFKDAALSSQQGFRDSLQLYPLSAAFSPSSHAPLLPTVDIAPSDHAPAAAAPLDPYDPAAAPPLSLSHDHATDAAHLFFDHGPAASFDSTPVPAVSPLPKPASMLHILPPAAISALPQHAAVSPECSQPVHSPISVPAPASLSPAPAPANSSTLYDLQTQRPLMMEVASSPAIEIDLHR